MHFTGMGAADFSQCFTSVGPSDVTPETLAMGIAGASIVILLAALGGLYLDLRDRRRTEQETDRMRGLADAAIEGLIVCDREAIVTANRSFSQLAGTNLETLAGRPIADFLTPVACTALFEHPDLPVETEMTTANGDSLPVEAILREVEFGGRRHFAIAIRDLSARKRAEQHIRFLAHHDALTGLPNRASFNEELAISMKHAHRQGQHLAVLCLDLDRFKEVNDLFGHAAGDALLQRVAAALLRITGKDQFAARLGGDEFAVIATGIVSPADGGRIAEAVLDAFRRENDAAADGIAISTSIGVALYPDNAADAEQLMNYADTALYRAKRDGRGIYRFFETEMGAAVRDRRLLEHDLRQALARNQLALVYQPQVNLQSGEITGFEALLRWEHPERGSVSPSVFLPIAEESGLILQIGEWVMRNACAEACRWSNPLSIAINVSTVQLHNPHFAHMVTEILVQTGLSPKRLEIEITESALIQDIGRALTTLRQVKALGVRIAMDDFGTGYSSLANLRAFPFDKIKVDQSFIKSVDNNGQSAAIVRAVLGLGNGLNLPVVAEGVERQEELDFLKGEICTEAQGFFLGRPQGIEYFSDLTSGRTTHMPARQAVADQERAIA
jgi:diguanylate cyclase (GGDEF)-like protein/PAS domain S-box-containing protein